MLKTLHLSATEDTPEVHLNQEERIFAITGRSLPEDAVKYYQPILNWMEAFAKLPNPAMELQIKLNYFNSTSAKQLLNMFLKLEPLCKSGNDVRIVWIYQAEDELIRARGEELQSLVDIPFVFKPE